MRWIAVGIRLPRMVGLLASGRFVPKRLDYHGTGSCIGLIEGRRIYWIASGLRLQRA